VVIGAFAPSDRAAAHAFAAASRAAGAAAVSLAVGARDILIGPLALPERIGCGACAVDRMIGAAAGAARELDRGEASPEEVRLAVRALVEELRHIRRHGAAASRLIDHVLVVDPKTKERTLHRIVPLAGCAVCGGAAAATAPPPARVHLDADAGLEALFDALDGWVDARAGVIGGVVLEPPNDMPLGAPFVATAAPPHVIDASGETRMLPVGWGKGLTVSAAVLSAVGEAIERYSASLPDPSRVVWQSLDDLDGDILDPRECALYTTAQYESTGFPFARFDPSTPHPWVRGAWLDDGEPVWVPAVLAYLSLTLTPEQLICQGTSNGLAASFDPDDASLRAALELIERDALMTAWLTGRAGERILIAEGLDSSLEAVLDGVRGLGAAVELYRLPTSACGCTVLALALGDGRRYPGATIALGTSVDSAGAMAQAILELGQTGPHLASLMQQGRVRAPGEPSAVVNMLDHAAFYFPADRAAAFDALRNGDVALPLNALLKGSPADKRGDAAGRLETLRTALGAAGIRVAIVDVTSADVMRGPFVVRRAVSPDLQPISYGYGLDREPTHRVRQMGLAAEAPPVHPIW
jgi:ribosomal protein S12 methylthiotransferase accessory factor